MEGAQGKESRGPGAQFVCASTLNYSRLDKKLRVSGFFLFKEIKILIQHDCDFLEESLKLAAVCFVVFYI